MCLIRTFIDFRQRTLFVESPRCDVKLQISLEHTSRYGRREDIDLYGQRYEVETYNDEVNLWFTRAVARPCSLMRCFGSESHNCMNKSDRVGMCRDV